MAETTQWTPVGSGTKIPEGVPLDVITPSGDQRILIFKNGLWWLEDMSMYCYFAPAFWRVQ